MQARKIIGLAHPARLARAARDLARARRVAAENGVSVMRILREQVNLHVSRNLHRDEYYMYGLYDPKMPWEQKLSYLSADDLRRLWYLLVSERYHHLYKNKLIFKRRYMALGFPLARLMAVYDPVWGKTESGAPLRTADELAAWMATPEANGCVFKPIESAEGQMVFVFPSARDNPRRLAHISGEEYDAKRLHATINDQAALRLAYPDEPILTSFLVEERIRQHPSIVELIGETLCCVRMLTLIRKDGSPTLHAASWKVQVSPTGTDNLVGGALVAEVDVESGRVGPGRRREEPAAARHETLPGTNKRLAGFVLPHWQKARQLALDAAAAFPNAAAIGWDIAIGENGAVLVEGNAAWGGSILQLPAAGGLLRGEMMEWYERLKASR